MFVSMGLFKVAYWSNLARSRQTLNAFWFSCNIASPEQCVQLVKCKIDIFSENETVIISSHFCTTFSTNVPHVLFLFISLSSDCPGHHDTGHYLVLCGFLCLHPSALPSEAGGKICLYGHHSALVRWVHAYNMYFKSSLSAHLWFLS